MSTSTVRLTRRQALGLAATGAVAAGSLRLVTAHLAAGSSPPTSMGGPQGAWQSPLDDRTALAAHFLRRAGFGYTEEELAAAAGMSYTDLVESVLQQHFEEPSTPPADVTSYLAVSRWWYQHMATTTAQFPERMLLFWHGILTTDYRKAGRFPFIWQQNRLYRRLGTGNFRDLLLAVTFDPAMMRYLDLDESRKGAPNENYSRELMELFTLGVGNYTEGDVREGARALSGIRIRVFDANGDPIALPKRTKTTTVAEYQRALRDLVASGATFKGVLDPRLHDDGAKTYLGRSGDLGPEDVIDAILAKPACATFIATKALTFFGTPTPSRDLVERVADAFRSSNYDIKTMMRAIFTSDEFRDPSNYRSLVRSPADYMVATMRALGRPELAPLAVAAGAQMDQVLYDPPTVAGWPINAGWISSGSWLARTNFAHVVVSRSLSFPDPVSAVHHQLDGVVGDDTAAVFNGSSTPGDRWYAILASPEFQLK
jgi:uncharacterized protein (DUF1800 family)